MRLVAIGIGFVLVVSACGSKGKGAEEPSTTQPVAAEPAPPVEAVEPAPAAKPEPCADNECGIRGMEYYADAVCRCGADEACALAIEEESRQWAMAEKADLDWITTERGKAAYGRFFICFQDARKAKP